MDVDWINDVIDGLVEGVEREREESASENSDISMDDNEREWEYDSGYEQALTSNEDEDDLWMAEAAERQAERKLTPEMAPAFDEEDEWTSEAVFDVQKIVGHRIKTVELENGTKENQLQL